MAPATDQLQAYVEYLRDLGIYDLYRQAIPSLLKLSQPFFASLPLRR